MSIQPRLLINLDVNGVLILKDTNKNADPDGMLNACLADSIRDNWDNNHGVMTFTQYVYDVLLPGEKSDLDLKNRRYIVLSKFMSWMEDRKHPALSKVKAVYEKIRIKFTDAASREVKFTVFPAFYVMVEKLKKDQVPFTIILRTFGGDLNEVVEEIERHPCGIKFAQRGKFQDAKLTLDKQGTIEKVETVFDTFLKSQDHFAIKDDWSSWNKDKEYGRSGKPFIYDTQGNRHGVRNLSLFFDDCITGETQDIIRVMEIAERNKTVKDLQNRMLFPVNTVELLLDDNYLYDRITQAIQHIPRL